MDAQTGLRVSPDAFEVQVKQHGPFRRRDVPATDCEASAANRLCQAQLLQRGDAVRGGVQTRSGPRPFGFDLHQPWRPAGALECTSNRESSDTAPDNQDLLVADHCRSMQ